MRRGLQEAKGKEESVARQKIKSKFGKTIRLKRDLSLQKYRGAKVKRVKKLNCRLSQLGYSELEGKLEDEILAEEGYTSVNYVETKQNTHSDLVQPEIAREDP